MPADHRMTPLEQLALTVLRNAKVRTLEDAAARVVLEVDVTYPGWLGPLPRLLGAKNRKKLVLDGMAMQLWRRIDDRTTLGGHIDWLAAEHMLAFNESRLLVLHFLRSLSQQGLVVLGDRTGAVVQAPQA